jgi:hypothetical protein
MSVFYNIPPANNDLAALVQAASSISNNVSQAIAHTSGATQNDALYELVRQKNIRVRSLRERFSQIKEPKIYLTDHIFHAVDLKGRMELFNIKDRNEPFVDSIVILSNNNVMVDNTINKYIQLWLNSPTSIFVIWDFDNHHWFSLSSMLAACSDLYVPTHSDNLEPLARYNNIMMGPVCSGVIQWSKEFLRDNASIIDDTVRSDEPFGTHIEYPQFPYRNKNLKLLAQKMSNVKLVDGSYHSREMIDRFTEWCSYKVHWIVPVLNDAPIRIFDTLITGGIPIVPRSLKYHRDVIDLHKHVLFYDYEDIQNPLTISENGVKMFNEGGKDGVIERHLIAVDNYHVDNRVQTILKGVYDEFSIPGDWFWLY